MRHTAVCTQPIHIQDAHELNNKDEEKEKNTSSFNTPSIPVLRAQFTNHAIPKYLRLLGIFAFKVLN
jgi:hypothetical protein